MALFLMVFARWLQLTRTGDHHIGMRTNSSTSVCAAIANYPSAMATAITLIGCNFTQESLLAEGTTTERRLCSFSHLHLPVVCQSSAGRAPTATVK